MNHSTFWLPPTFTHREVNEVRKAVKEYDPNLDFGKNEKTGDWCVFLKQGTMAGSAKGDLPILGWRNIPDPQSAVKRIYDTDAMRHGKEMLDAINRHNEDINQGFEDRTAKAEGELAEAFEWGMRKSGITSHKRIYTS